MSIIRIEHDIAGIRRFLEPRRGAPVVLAPTMGALHEGHVELVRDARRLATRDGTVVVSVFVNPTQFGPKEDLAAYPRDLAGDVAKCEAVGADVVFAPDANEIYRPDASIEVSERCLSTLLCGASRPGHFDGVCLVVLKLFNIVRPTTAVFGKKDRQQLAVIERMVRDLDLEIEINGVETIREADGLAMSSRNAYLTPEQRQQAPAIRKALLAAADHCTAGETDSARLIANVREALEANANLGRLDYLEVVDPSSMQPIAKLDELAIMAVAYFFDRCRLIDNIDLKP